MSQWHLCAMCIGLTLVGPRYTPQVGKIAITRQVTAIVIGLSIVFGSQWFEAGFSRNTSSCDFAASRLANISEVQVRFLDCLTHALSRQIQSNLGTYNVRVRRGQFPPHRVIDAADRWRTGVLQGRSQTCLENCHLSIGLWASSRHSSPRRQSGSVASVRQETIFRRRSTSAHYLQILYIDLSEFLIEGSLDVKLPTIWTDEKQRWEESERREE